MSRTALMVATASSLSVLGAGAWAQTTIETDGNVQAQGFIGDGSQVTSVDAATLDGSDSSDFAGATETADVIAALQAELAQLRRCLPVNRYLVNDDVPGKSPPRPAHTPWRSR